MKYGAGMLKSESELAKLIWTRLWYPVSLLPPSVGVAPAALCIFNI